MSVYAGVLHRVSNQVKIFGILRKKSQHNELHLITRASVYQTVAEYNTETNYREDYFRPAGSSVDSNRNVNFSDSPE